jgi:hypothetical protein
VQTSKTLVQPTPGKSSSSSRFPLVPHSIRATARVFAIWLTLGATKRHPLVRWSSFRRAVHSVSGPKSFRKIRTPTPRITRRRLSLLHSLRLLDGSPAEPAEFVSSEPNWRIGDPVRIGADVRYTITGISYDEQTDTTTWIVMPANGD